MDSLMTEHTDPYRQGQEWIDLVRGSAGLRLPLIAMALELLDRLAQSQGGGDVLVGLHQVSAADLDGFATKLLAFGAGLTTGEQRVLAQLLRSVLAASAADPRHRL